MKYIINNKNRDILEHVNTKDELIEKIVYSFHDAFEVPEEYINLLKQLDNKTLIDFLINQYNVNILIINE